MFRNTLLGITTLAETSLQSCVIDLTDNSQVTMNVCPKTQTVLKNTKGTTPKVNYILHSLNILPEQNDILDIDSICFSDSKNNRYIISNPQMEYSTLKLDVEKRSNNAEPINGNIHLRDVGTTLKMTPSGLGNGAKNIMEDGSKPQRFNQCNHDSYTGIYQAEGQYLTKDSSSFYYIIPKVSEEKYNQIKVVLKDDNP